MRDARRNCHGEGLLFPSDAVFNPFSAVAGLHTLHYKAGRDFTRTRRQSTFMAGACKRNKDV
jgi:hypothetical protein